MNVFLTGATGYIGGAVAAELLRGGHEVAGLTSAEEKAEALERAGVRPVVGDLADPGSWRPAAARAEALIHAAFAYGAEDPVDLDALAVDALLSAAGEGSGRRSVVYTSGVWVLGDTGDAPADETAALTAPFEIVAWRPAHEQVVLGAGRTGAGRLAAAVVRPGVVYGGRGGLAVRFFESALESGASAYIGEGRNRMALVHRDDLARLYREAVERGAAGVFHGVDGTPIPMAEAAAAASRAAGAGGEVSSVPLAEAREVLGPVADALCLDQVVAAPRSRDELGWVPRYGSFREGAGPAFREWRGEAESEGTG